VENIQHEITQTVSKMSCKVVITHWCDNLNHKD